MRAVPGGDVNPHLAFAAIVAAGLPGIEAELELPPALEGNAYEPDAKRFPSTLRHAIAALEAVSVAHGGPGDQVVDHYLNYARTEQALFDKVVTEGLGARVRGMPRIYGDHRVGPDSPARACTRRTCRRGSTLRA